MTETERVHGLAERYDRWTGRAWLEVRGERPGSTTGTAARRPLRTVPIGPGYATEREALRAAFPDRPFDADWSDGRFAPSPFGLPLHPVIVTAWAASAAGVAAGAWLAGPWGAAALAVACGWPLLRLLDGVQVGARGVRVGPPWSLVIPWHDVQAMGVTRSGRAVHVWVRGRHGAASGTVPPVLVPAVKARVRRLGGISLEEGDGGLDLRYARWRAPAAGIPWGVLGGTLVGAMRTPEPWSVLGIGLFVVAGLALLGAAVEARAGGWGTGATGWLTLLYALVLAALTLGGWGAL